MTTLRRHLVFLISALLLTISAHAGTLDDYYLQQFGEAPHLQLQKAVLLATGELEANRCGMPLKRALQRDWALLESSTQKVLAKQLAAPVLSSPATYKLSGGHFLIHYSSDPTSADAPPLTDANNNGIPDWVETVASTFEDVYASYVARGYQPAPTAGGAPYDIYLSNLAPQGYYGVTNSGSAVSAPYPNAFTSWMELDNNFTDAIYKPSLYTPLQSLQITAAHEYHHAIQYGYTFYFDIWYAEATSTWMEDELYDSVNQNYSYLNAWFTNSTTPLDLAVDANAVSSGAGYGRWIFNRYLSEAYPTQNAVRSSWEKVGTLSSPSGNDIPMVPVLESVLAAAPFNSSLGDAFFGFAKRYYQRNWTSHATELAKIPAASPVTSYTTYPVNATASTFKPAIALSHYSFAYYRFIPSSGAPLTITLAATSGIKTAAFRKDSGGTITELTFNQSFSTYNDPGFGSAQEVVLLIANVTNTDGQNANFSTDGSTVAVTPPSTTPVTNITGTTTPPLSFGNSSSNGCFIATAAYGSYLHPRVQLLRDFRDHHLLTTAPGRAFVALYYRLSPPLADAIAQHPLLRSATRLALTPLLFSVAYPATAGALLLICSGGIVLRLRRQRATAPS